MFSGPKKSLQESRQFASFCPSSQVVAFLSSSGASWSPTAIPVRCHACSLAGSRKTGRAEAKGFTLGQGGISIIICIMLGNMAILGSKCARKCEQVAEVTIIWIAMTGLRPKLDDSSLGMGPLLTSNRIKISLATDK